MGNRKLFAGARIRNLRQKENLTQRGFAERLGVSTSYLNQLENNQRPLSAAVILAMVDQFEVDIARFASDESDRVITDLREVLVDPIFGQERPSLQELKIVTSNTPEFAHAFLALHRAYQGAKERLASLDDALQREEQPLAPTPYEEVRDFFHYRDNYIDWLDRGAETFAYELGADSSSYRDALIQRLADRHSIRVLIERTDIEVDMFRKFDTKNRILHINGDIPIPTQVIQLLQQIALLEEVAAIENILDEAQFKTKEARAVAKIGLSNYFAGAAMLPYTAFIKAARELRHDIERLADRFGASLEQVAHRLSTLQRAGVRGVPFFFVRIDRAGTITKRHSATRLQFARFGGACPLWNVHQAFERPETIVRQLAETPDGERYVSIARTITKRRRSYNAPIRRYAIALGCPVGFAKELIYADGLDLNAPEAFDQIGISCRICNRVHCQQRSVPPIGHTIHVDPNRRNIVPFEIRIDQ